MVVEARISEYIRNHGIRQSFICEKADIDQDAFSKILNGKRDMKLDDFERMCKVLKKSPNDFVKPEEIE